MFLTLLLNWTFEPFPYFYFQLFFRELPDAIIKPKKEMDYQKWGQIPMFNDEEVLYEQLKDLLKHSIDPILKPTLKGMRCSLTPSCGHSF